MRQFSIIWVGNSFFSPALAESASEGFSWRVHGINPPENTVLGWDDLVASAGFRPDLVMVGDKSQPPFVTGMENFPCLTAFYAVDTHIHSWYPRYAQAFDLCLVSLRDHIPLFNGARLAKDMVWWSPPYAHPLDAPRPLDPEKPLRDVLFVGTADPATNPERRAFLDAVAERVPTLHVTSGRYRDLYPQAKIVLNHAARGDLNFRVFEALGCGACLVTPLVRHGFEELFTNGRDLFTFDQNDIEGLAKLLHALLAAPKRREAVAAHGHATVKNAHYMRHRADAFAERAAALFVSGKAEEIVGARLKTAREIHRDWLKLIYLHHAETAESPDLAAAYLKASRG